MRAVLHDCEGPLRNRIAPLFFLPIPFVLAALGVSHLLSFGLFTLFATLPGVLLRFAPRSVEVELGGGTLRLKSGGLLSQTLSTKDVIGASTARVSEGIALTLARRDRKTPTTLVFENEADLDHAREALAVGHGGFGQVRWPLAPAAADTWAPAARALGAAGALIAAALAVAAGLSQESAYAVFGWMVLVFAWIPAFMGLVGAASRYPSQSVELGPRGVDLVGFQRTQVPYAMVQGIASSQGIFELGVQGHGLRAAHRLGAFAGAGVDPNEMRILGAQLAACVGRASGKGPEKQETRTRVDTLRRGHESARDWLARIDVAANMLTQSGYRGGTIEKEDLWLLLRDPEASEDLRAAAGRMLVRTETDPEARVRIGDIVSAVREEPAQRRLRVAIFPELDPNGHELEELEERSLRKQALG